MRRTTIYLALRAHPDAPDPTGPEWRAEHPDADMDAFDRALTAYMATVAEPCVRCGRPHERLWSVRRVPVDTFGNFPVYRIGGRKQVVDLSLPHTLRRLPRDAQPVPPERAAELWHEDNETHVFGGPNVAAALRATIRAANEGR